jgi:hypothetical protein
MDAIDLPMFVYYVCYVFLLMPLGVGLRYWPRLDGANRLLWAWLLTVLVLEVLANVLGILATRNLFLNYPYTLAMVWIGALFYGRVQGWRWAVWVAVGLTVGCGIEVWGWVGFNNINSLTLSLSILVLAGYGFRSLWLLMDSGRGESLQRHPYFFQHLGFLVFGFLPAFFMYFKSYFIETSLDFYFFSQTLTSLLAGVSFCLFAIGLYRDSRAVSVARPAVIRS